MSKRVQPLTEFQLTVLRIDAERTTALALLPQARSSEITAARRVLERRGLLAWTDRCHREVTAAGHAALVETLVAA